MSKRGKNVTEGVTDAEVVSIKTGKSIAELPLDKPDLQPNAEEQAVLKAREEEVQAKLKAEEYARDEQRAATLQANLDAALKQHQEKASLAFELLKSVMSQKSETVLAANAFNQLVKNVYTLADTFKKEVDERWTVEVQGLTQSAKPSHSDETTSQTVN